jgi:8-oxo-dGTP pyrophosphatase MutT (NUDIX family)
MRCVMTQPQGGRKPLMDDAEWYASLPSFTASGALLLTDAAGGVLLVKPWYRDEWQLPGGVAEAAESPRQCAEREAAEEVGVAVTATALLAVHWMPSDGPRRASFAFVFDGGTLTDPGAIRLQHAELDDFAFLPLDEATARMAGPGALRLEGAWQARTDGRPAYLESLG